MRTPSTSSFQAPDGTPFRAITWPAPADSDVALVIHHGPGEHAGRYETVVRGLQSAPIHICSWDARGHGHSGGRKGHAMGFDQMVDDMEFLMPQLLEKVGAKRAVLFGHSMGAAVVGRYLTRRAPHASLVGAWISAPPLQVDKSSLEMRIKSSASRVLARIVPSLTMASSLPVEGISSVPAEVKRYTDDPLIHDRVSARLGYSLLYEAPVILDEAGAITLPVLLWHGAEDPISNAQGSRDLFARVGSEDKALEVFEGARHEVHHEAPGITDSLFAMMRGWLADHGLC